ncbi:TPA: bacteriocin [Citrobacter amalonaticus]
MHRKIISEKELQVIYGGNYGY